VIPPVGKDGIDTTGVDVPDADMAELLAVDRDAWREQLPQVRAHFAQFDNLPAALTEQLDALEQRLAD
jgi:phosphoenolpyruvate carboxykinase (GTP)